VIAQRARGRFLLLVLLLAVPACVSVGMGPAEQRTAEPVTNDDAITIASFNFPESVLLAEIYARALEANRFRVKRALDLGPRELVEPALERGLVEFVPEYLGSALAFLEEGSHQASADPTTDPTTTRRRLAEIFRGRRVHVLEPAQAQDANALAVTTHTSTRFNLRTVSDLGPVAATFVLGGPPECPSRPHCLVGLQSKYRLRFKQFLALDSSGPVTAEGLALGLVDVAVLFETDGNIPAKGFVVLQDDLGLQPAENVTPVVREEVLARYGQRFTDVVDAVSAKLTTEDLREMNRLITVGSRPPSAVADDWLRTMGFLEG
jgi:osmoprotectant transport system substrate-binding protein